LRLHFARRLGAPVGLDTDLRAVNVGKELDRKAVERKGAEEDRDRNPDRHSRRAFQGRPCQSTHMSLSHSVPYDSNRAIPI
jgi:hypothetical protein